MRGSSNGLEVRFCEWLDRCYDVDSFAKLALDVRFKASRNAVGDLGEVELLRGV